MRRVRANSSPDLVMPTRTQNQQYDDLALQGVAANVKLLLKLIQDHKMACDQEKNEHRRMLRVATMMTILDSVRERIQKCQSFGNKKTEPAKLTRSNTELKHNNPVPKDKRTGGGGGVADDEKERLKRDLNVSLATQKRLQVMCSSLGKEKAIMDSELSKKVHELSEMEELISSLKEQNETLRQKVQECASEHNKKYGSGGGGVRVEPHVAVVLQERNKVLSEQLLRSLDGYRSMKRKLKAAQEENILMHATMDEMGGKVVRSLERVTSLKERMSSSSGSDSPVDIQEEIMGLESMFECFPMLVKKQGECAQPNGEINAYKPSVLA